jgi:hypothetical protein
MHDANEALEMNSPDIIERERAYERMLIDLRKQFEKIDTNRDGSINR